MKATSGHQARAIVWRVIGQYLPIAAFTLAAFLAIRAYNDRGGSEPRTAVVAVDHAQNLAENIRFFEAHVAETKDSLSYNKLTGLYLQRVRESGDVSDIKRADLAASAAVAASGRDYSSLISLAMVRIAQHDFEDALRLSQEALAQRPTAADAHALIGDAQMALGQYGAASESYRIFLDRAPSSSAFARQAVLAETRGNVPLAEQFWNAAIDADRADAPESAAWARVQFGNLLFTTGELDGARKSFEASLKVYPGYSAAQAGLAKVAAAKGDRAAAIDGYRKATAVIPQAEYVAALGDLYAAAGNAGEAQRQYGLISVIQQLFEVNGVRNDLTLITFDLDHGKASPATLDRARLAYEQRPSLAAADTYAWALFRAGRLDEANEKSSEALRLGTKDPFFLFHAGMIALARGDTARARESLQAVRDLNQQFSILHAAEAANALKQVSK